MAIATLNTDIAGATGTQLRSGPQLEKQQYEKELPP